MYKLVVAFRYLRRNWLNIVGVIAVMIGVLVLICVLSVMKGFDEELRSRIRSSASDLIVENRSDDAFAGYEEILAKIEKIPEVAACAPQFEGLGIVRMGEGKSLTRYAQFHGIDLEREKKATDFAECWRTWRGKQGRDALAMIFADNATALGLAMEDDVGSLLSRLRKQDYEFLDRTVRKKIENWARANKFDLGAAIVAGSDAVPEWQPIDDPKYSPAFAGDEMLILGRDPSGRLLQIEPGEDVVLVAPTGLEDRAIRRCRIVGGYRSGLSDYDARNIFLPLQDVQQMLGKPGRITTINVKLKSFDDAPKVRAALLGILTPEELRQGLGLVRDELGRSDPATLRSLEQQLAQLKQNLPNWFSEGNPFAVLETVNFERTLRTQINAIYGKAGGPATDPVKKRRALAYEKMLQERQASEIGKQFRINTWEDVRRPLLGAVAVERRIMGIILFFVILIAGFLILSILHTTVVMKTRDIGILKSLGGSTFGILSIFLINGLLMGVVGSVLGAVGGLLITRNINEILKFLDRVFGFSLFPSNIYLFDHIPLVQNPFPGILMICLLATGMSLVASIYPALKASRMDPVEALRYE